MWLWHNVRCTTGDLWKLAALAFCLIRLQLNEARLAHAGGRTPRDLPVHRDLVQSQTTALDLGDISPAEYEQQWQAAA